jgi:hypothetical protein
MYKKKKNKWKNNNITNKKLKNQKIKKKVKKLLNLERLQFKVHYSKLAHTLGEGCIIPRKNEAMEKQEQG